VFHSRTSFCLAHSPGVPTSFCNLKIVFLGRATQFYSSITSSLHQIKAVTHIIYIHCGRKARLVLSVRRLRHIYLSIYLSIYYIISPMQIDIYNYIYTPYNYCIRYHWYHVYIISIKPLWNQLLQGPQFEPGRVCRRHGDRSGCTPRLDFQSIPSLVHRWSMIINDNGVFRSFQSTPSDL